MPDTPVGYQEHADASQERTRTASWFFGYLRALRTSDLPPAARYVLVELARQAGRDGHVPDSPAMSLTALCADLGMSCAALATTLTRVERDGWLIRVRPTKADAQKLHARTRYRVVTPGQEVPRPALELLRNLEEPTPESGGELLRNLEEPPPESGDRYFSGSSCSPEKTPPGDPSPVPPTASAVADAPKPRSSRSRGRSKPKPVGDHQRARANAGPIACAALDANPDITISELTRLVTEHDPDLHQGQAHCRALRLKDTRP